ncbi:MAG: hypothetical protein IKS48_12515 [Eubacterium sp.]|nr:hypothetical protein [Eubacterium sp.]
MKVMKKMCKKTKIISLLLALIILFMMLAVYKPNGISTVHATVPPYYPYPDPIVHLQGHVQNIGWMDETTEGLIGTTGKSLRLEAFKIGIMPNNDPDIYIPREGSYEGELRATVIGYTSTGGVYKDYIIVKCGEMSKQCGTVGKSQPIAAISLELKGEIKNYYDIEYRVHVQDEGWKPWVKNFEFAKGSKYQRIEALEVRLVRNKRAPHYPLIIDPIPVPEPYPPIIQQDGREPDTNSFIVSPTK